MKRLAVVVCLLAACTTAPPPASQHPNVPTSQPAPPRRSPNAFTPVASVAKTIVEPRIKVGMLSDQTTVSFPRVAGGYYLIADSGSFTLRRGFTLTAPLGEAAARYAVQVSAISDETSAVQLVEKLRGENAGLRLRGGSRGRGERFNLLRRRSPTVLRGCDRLKSRSRCFTES